MGSFDRTTGPEQQPDITNTAQAMMQSASDNLRAQQISGPAKNESGGGWEKTGTELLGTLGAGTAGTLFWSLASRSELGLPVRLLGTALVSGATRVGVQGGLEHLLLKPEQRTSAKDEFLWGTVDGFAGVIGTAAESKVAEGYMSSLGRSYLGRDISDELAATAGRKAIENSLRGKFLYNGVRGITGGAVGSFAWSIPHAFYDNRDHLNSVDGWVATAQTVGLNTAFGAVTGGVLSGGLTALGNARDVAGYTAAKLQGDAGVTRVKVLHFNDLHSSLVGEKATLSQISTMSKQLRADAAAKGIPTLVYDAGDNFSGNVAAGFTDTGYVETKAINMMPVDGFVPGNHVADAGNGEVNVDAWYKNIQRISKELNRELPAIGANIEVPKYPHFIGPSGEIYKPYRIAELAGANGSLRIGQVGLVTHELVDAAKPGTMTYLDAQQSARQWIGRLTAENGGEGLNKVIVLSHLGRSEDIALAKEVPGISYIPGAHSHDAEPVLIWVQNRSTKAWVPIMQAGSSGRWLAETDLAFKPDGTIDRYRTTGRLHQISADIKHDPQIHGFVEEHVSPVAALEAHKYDVNVTGVFSTDGLRGQYVRQTPLGTLISKSLFEGVNNHLPELNAARAAEGLTPLEPIDMVIKHTGDIRAGIDGTPTHRSLSDMFLNTGSAEREQREMTAIQLRGSDVQKVLNFGVGDFAKPIHLENQQTGLVGALKEAMTGPQPEPFHDYTGNFQQTEGLQYSVDLSQPPGERISNVRVRDPQTGEFTAIDQNKTYNILTLYHPLEKWAKNGVFGDSVRAGGEQAARSYANAQPVPLSQVDLLAEYLTKHQPISPENFVSPNITDLTPPRWQPTVKPDPYVLGTLAAQDAKRDK